MFFISTRGSKCVCALASCRPWLMRTHSDRQMFIEIFCNQAYHNLFLNFKSPSSSDATMLTILSSFTNRTVHSSNLVKMSPIEGGTGVPGCGKTGLPVGKTTPLTSSYDNMVDLVRFDVCHQNLGTKY